MFRFLHLLSVLFWGFRKSHPWQEWPVTERVHSYCQFTLRGVCTSFQRVKNLIQQQRILQDAQLGAACGTKLSITSFLTSVISHGCDSLIIQTSSPQQINIKVELLNHLKWISINNAGLDQPGLSQLPPGAWGAPSTQNARGASVNRQVVAKEYSLPGEERTALRGPVRQDTPSAANQTRGAWANFLLQLANFYIFHTCITVKLLTDA